MNSEAECGFRHDPMAFVEHGDNVAVRVLLFGNPRPEDARRIAAELERLLIFEPGEPGEDGQGAPFKINADNFLRLVQLGAGEEHPEIERALQLLDLLPERPAEPIEGPVLHALCLLGRADHPTIRNSLRLRAARPEELLDPDEGCPWTPAGSLSGLWAARELEPVGDIVIRSLEVIRDRLEGTGSITFNDPWGFVHCAAHIDHPVAREILNAQLPMILRAQREDGGWGEYSFDVLAALKRHGLFEELRRKPPLPSDWNVVHSIPAPEGELFGFTWDGEQLWTGERSANQAIAVSPEDGRVLARVDLPEGHGRWLAWWEDRIHLTQGSPGGDDPKRLHRIDPKSGEVEYTLPLEKLEHVGGVLPRGGELIVIDSYFGWEFSVEGCGPAGPCQRDTTLACPMPVAGNPAGKGAAWYVDHWTPWVIEVDDHGHLLDWAERPFGSYQGLVWDGVRHWAIDREAGRICVVEKTATAPRF